MKIFDWGKAQKTHNQHYMLWLEIKYTQALSESEYIDAMQKLKKYSSATGKARQKAYCPSHLKRNYRYLKETFGFFQGHV